VRIRASGLKHPTKVSSYFLHSGVWTGYARYLRSDEMKCKAGHSDEGTNSKIYFRGPHKGETLPYGVDSRKYPIKIHLVILRC